MTQRLLPGLVVTLALVLVANAAPASAAPGDGVPVVITFEGRAGSADVTAVERAGGRVEHRYEIVPAVAAVVPVGLISQDTPGEKPGWFTSMQVKGRLRTV